MKQLKRYENSDLNECQNSLRQKYNPTEQLGTVNQSKEQLPATTEHNTKN